MKRQYFKTPAVVSGIFAGALLAAVMAQFFQAAPETVEIKPAAGHWLKTEQDRWYKPAAPEFAKSAKTAANLASPVLSLEEARTALNRLTDSINIMYVWTDDDELKVISVTSFNKATRQAAIVVIPLHTVINNGNPVNLKKEYVTVGDLYREKGRDGVRRLLEQKLGIKIANFVHVNQSALRKLSDIIGVLKVNGGETTMLEAFEETAAGIRTDDREVVRAVASQVLQPRMLLEAPKLLWIFTHDITTDFSVEQMIGIFHFSRQMNLQDMRKTALPGYEYGRGGSKYLFVSDQTWKNIIYEITR